MAYYYIAPSEKCGSRNTKTTPCWPSTTPPSYQTIAQTRTRHPAFTRSSHSQPVRVLVRLSFSRGAVGRFVKRVHSSSIHIHCIILCTMDQQYPPKTLRSSFRHHRMCSLVLCSRNIARILYVLL
jgi:hypothetical protein